MAGAAQEQTKLKSYFVKGKHISVTSLLMLTRRLIFIVPFVSVNGWISYTTKIDTKNAPPKST